MIEHPWLVGGVGVAGVLVGVSLLVVLASRRARDRRAQRKRVAARRAAYRQGSVQASWPWAEPMPPLRGGVYRGARVRDVEQTAIMARVRGGEDRG